MTTVDGILSELSGEAATALDAAQMEVARILGYCLAVSGDESNPAVLDMRTAFKFIDEARDLVLDADRRFLAQSLGDYARKAAR